MSRRIRQLKSRMRFCPLSRLERRCLRYRIFSSLVDCQASLTNNICICGKNILLQFWLSRASACFSRDFGALSANGPPSVHPFAWLSPLPYLVAPVRRCGPSRENCFSSVLRCTLFSPVKIDPGEMQLPDFVWDLRFCAGPRLLFPLSYWPL